MILFYLYAGFGSGLKVSGGNSFEFYANLEVFHVFRCFSGLFVFLTVVLFYWIKWVLKRRLLLEQILDNN